MKLFLAIDATNWICCLWHAQGGRGVLDMVSRRIDALAESFQPSHVIACFDRRSFRHDLFPAYKAHRKPKPAGLQRDLDEGPAAVAQVAVPCAVNGFEADDCLATVARDALAAGGKAIIASPDKDLNQCLVPDLVIILRQFTLHADAAESFDWWNAAALYKHYGIAPGQWVDYQTLVGDSGDGVPGCKGWGEKTTLPALQKAGSLDAMFANPWSLPITPRQQQALLGFRKEAELMRQLVTLKTDVPDVWDALR